MTYISMTRMGDMANMSEKEILNERANLERMYREDPKGTYDMLEKHLSSNPSLIKAFGSFDRIVIESSDKDKSQRQFSSDANSRYGKDNKLGGGFLKFREILNYKDQNNFETDKAKKYRLFFSDTQLLFEEVMSYDNFGGTNYSEVITLCGDGRFSYQNSNLVSMTNGYSAGNELVEGFWEVFTQDAYLILSLYSTNKVFTDINPTGFIPMVIINAQNDVVRIKFDPKDRLYRRSEISCH